MFLPETKVEMIVDLLAVTVAKPAASTTTAAITTEVTTTTVVGVWAIRTTETFLGPLAVTWVVAWAMAVNLP